jgi:hypothetical protein
LCISTSPEAPDEKEHEEYNDSNKDDDGYDSGFRKGCGGRLTATQFLSANKPIIKDTQVEL